MARAIKNAALGWPRSLFALYIHFINLSGVNRQGFSKFIWSPDNALAGIGAFGGLDKIRSRGGKTSSVCAGFAFYRR
jgi:hypothetical protein